MISTNEAYNLMQEFLPRFKSSVDICADRDYPPFHRVMMDGIALPFEDYKIGVRKFKIQGTCAAGEPVKTLSQGCYEVMTGAPLPVGADIVIQYEHLEINNGIASIIFETPRNRYDSVHLSGSDCKKGDTVLRSGSAINGPHVGIATSMGSSIFSDAPKVMIISTGNELVEKDPLPHQIRRSNVYAIKTSLELHGYTDIKIDHLNDDPKLITDHYLANASKYDLLIYSGGVSKGKFDYLPNIWSDLGVRKHFHEVAQRPGKPLWFGSDVTNQTVVVGLPGNPVSSLVCLHRYITPGREMWVKLTEEIIFKKDLTFFVPVKISFDTGLILATPLKIKNSGEFTALAGSDGFVELPMEKDHFKAGDILKFFSWSKF
jgi:molybdopterin molybdotransferase